MAEKVIGEIRFIETDDGFRIEVKGDKERLRQMRWDPKSGSQAGAHSWGMGFGPGKGFWRNWGRGRRHRRHGPPPPPPGASFWGGPCEWWSWWDEWDDEGEDESSEAPPKNV